MDRAVNVDPNCHRRLSGSLPYDAPSRTPGTLHSQSLRTASPSPDEVHALASSLSRTGRMHFTVLSDE